MMASNGASSGQPLLPSPTLSATLSKPSASSRRRAASPSAAWRSIAQQRVKGLLLARRLAHARDDEGLRYGLAMADGKRPVLIGGVLEAPGDELLARNLPHRLQHVRVHDAATGDLGLDHAGAGMFEIGHRRPPAGGTRRHGACSARWLFP